MDSRGVCRIDGMTKTRSRNMGAKRDYNTKNHNKSNGSIDIWAAAAAAAASTHTAHLFYAYTEMLGNTKLCWLFNWLRLEYRRFRTNRSRISLEFLASGEAEQ